MLTNMEDYRNLTFSVMSRSLPCSGEDFLTSLWGNRKKVQARSQPIFLMRAWRSQHQGRNAPAHGRRPCRGRVREGVAPYR